MLICCLGYDYLYAPLSKTNRSSFSPTQVLTHLSLSFVFILSFSVDSLILSAIHPPLRIRLPFFVHLISMKVRKSSAVVFHIERISVFHPNNHSPFHSSCFCLPPRVPSSPRPRSFLLAFCSQIPRVLHFSRRFHRILLVSSAITVDNASYLLIQLS